jgi:hypothetical protein
MGEWYGCVDKGIMMGAVAICVGIDVGAISSATRLPNRAARAMIRSGGFSARRCQPLRFAHRDLARSQQSPEQHRGSFRGRQHGMRLDPSLEHFMNCSIAFDVRIDFD